MNDDILLVEDEPDNVTLTLHALKENGIKSKVIVARDGLEALNYLFSADSAGSPGSRQLPKFVLLDLRMPRMDGLETLRRLRRHELTKLLPVVVLTSSENEEDITQSFALGANSYVCKPVQFAPFSAVLGKVVRYWLEINREAKAARVDPSLGATRPP